MNLAWHTGLGLQVASEFQSGMEGVFSIVSLLENGDVNVYSLLLWSVEIVMAGCVGTS